MELTHDRIVDWRGNPIKDPQREIIARAEILADADAHNEAKQKASAAPTNNTTDKTDP